MLHVRADPINAGVAMATGAGSGAITAGLIEQLEADATQREARARDGFERFCAETGLTVPGGAGRGNRPRPSAEFHVETGREPDWVAVYGRTSDLVVASRSADEALGRSTLEAVLLETGRPLLIPGPAAMPAAIERIAIAWKPVPQAARAVALAMPFLAACHGSHHRDGRGKRRGARRDRPPLALSRPARPPLDGRAHAAGSGRRRRDAAIGDRGPRRLLVMGGYGHSRVREWVFGGFTTHVLAGAPLPVLMAH